jgi:hypothetical protein
MANNSEWVHVFALVQGPDPVEGAHSSIAVHGPDGVNARAGTYIK